MEVSQNLKLTEGDINNNTQLTLPKSSSKLHTCSTSSAILKPSDIEYSLIRKSNTANQLNSSPDFKSNEVLVSNNGIDNSDQESDNELTNSFQNSVNKNSLNDKTSRRSKFIFYNAWFYIWCRIFLSNTFFTS